MNNCPILRRKQCVSCFWHCRLCFFSENVELGKDHEQPPTESLIKGKSQERVSTTVPGSYLNAVHQ